MSKLSKTLPVAITTLGLSVVTSLTPQAIAQEQPKCFMIEESGQFVDLSYLCDSLPRKKRPTTKKSSSSIKQPISSYNYSNFPFLSSNNSFNFLPSPPLVFAGFTPVAYINTRSSNTAYTSPTFLVRRFKLSGSRSSNSINRSRSIFPLVGQRQSIVIITRYK